MTGESIRVKATPWLQTASIVLIGWNLVVVLASSIGLSLMQQVAAVTFSNSIRGIALVVGALGGLVLGIWMAWAMHPSLSRQPFGRALAVFAILLALTYLVFPRSFTYIEYQSPSTQRP